MDVESTYEGAPGDRPPPDSPEPIEEEFESEDDSGDDVNDDFFNDEDSDDDDSNTFVPTDEHGPWSIPSGTTVSESVRKWPKFISQISTTQEMEVCGTKVIEPDTKIIINLEAFCKEKGIPSSKELIFVLPKMLQVAQKNHLENMDSLLIHMPLISIPIYTSILIPLLTRDQWSVTMNSFGCIKILNYIRYFIIHQTSDVLTQADKNTSDKVYKQMFKRSEDRFYDKLDLLKKEYDRIASPGKDDIAKIVDQFYSLIQEYTLKYIRNLEYHVASICGLKINQMRGLFNEENTLPNFKQLKSEYRSQLVQENAFYIKKKAESYDKLSTKKLCPLEIESYDSEPLDFRNFISHNILHKLFLFYATNIVEDDAEDEMEIS